VQTVSLKRYSKRTAKNRALRLVQDRAGIDISGPEFNFVRSIRVFDDGDCNRSATVVLGTYGTQGEFSWQRSSITALPAAHVGLERSGEIIAQASTTDPSSLIGVT